MSFSIRSSSEASGIQSSNWFFTQFSRSFMNSLAGLSLFSSSLMASFPRQSCCSNREESARKDRRSAPLENVSHQHMRFPWVLLTTQSSGPTLVSTIPLADSSAFLRDCRSHPASYWERPVCFTPAAGRDARGPDARILNQPVFHRGRPVLRKSHVVGMKALAVGVAFDQRWRAGIGRQRLVRLFAESSSASERKVYLSKSKRTSEEARNRFSIPGRLFSPQGLPALREFLS